MASPYEKSVFMGNFAGLNQDGDGRNLSLRYAVDAKNTDTTGGSLRPMKKGTKLTGELPGPIGTLARLHRRYHEVEAERDVLIAACGKKLYYRLLSGEDWTEITLTEPLKSDNFDYVTYEVSDEDATTDVLLLSNAYDGMLCVYGDDLRAEPVSTPYKFGVLARHMERIWGAGIPGDPDKLVYSAPYDPFNWEPNVEIPEDGSGEILQPSWDGDSFVALKPFGSQLLAIKKTRIWRVMGAGPADYVMREQYGGGSIEENTICVSGDYALMLGYSGVMIYSGADVTPFKQHQVRTLFSSVNFPAIQKAYAGSLGRHYVLALPIENSAINNAVLFYNVFERTFNVVKGLNVRAFLSIGDDLYFTTDTTPGTVWKWGEGESLPVCWKSGYQDFGGKNVVKNNFVAYLTVGVEENIDLSLTVRTEKKEKTKTVRITPGDAMKRVNISNSGRWVQFELATDTKEDWQLLGGMQVEMEIDHD